MRLRTRRTLTVWGAGLVILSGIVAWAGSANAQYTRETVKPIPALIDPEYQRQGFPFPDRNNPEWTLLPSISAEQTYTDNVFRTDGGKNSDLITVVTPQVDLRSGWEQHAINMHADFSLGYYNKFGAENFQDAFLSIFGRYDLSRIRDFYVYGTGSYREAHDARGDPESIVSAKRPGQWRVLGANLGLYKEFLNNRLSSRFEVTHDRYNYDDANNDAGEINHDDRDRRDYLGSLRVGYNFEPGTRWEVFVRGSGGLIDYDSSEDDNGFDRDSLGYTAIAGLQLDLTKYARFTEFEIYGGYMSRDYDDALLPTIAGPTFGFNVTYQHSRLTSVKADANRTIAESSLNGASGFRQINTGILLEHQFLRDLFGDVGFRYFNNRYKGTDREDHFYRASGGVKYLFNRYWSVDGRYTFNSRNTNFVGADYVESIYLVKITAQY